MDLGVFSGVKVSLIMSANRSSIGGGRDKVDADDDMIKSYFGFNPSDRCLDGLVGWGEE